MSESSSNVDSSFKVVKFNGKRDEDFVLWSLRMETALEAKSLFDVVDDDADSGMTTASAAAASDAGEAAVAGRDEAANKTKKVKAAAFIMSALGDKPRRAVASAKKDPAKIWKRLHERYASDSPDPKIITTQPLWC